MTGLEGGDLVKPGFEKLKRWRKAWVHLTDVQYVDDPVFAHMRDMAKKALKEHPMRMNLFTWLRYREIICWRVTAILHYNNPEYTSKAYTTLGFDWGEEWLMVKLSAWAVMNGYTKPLPYEVKAGHGGVTEVMEGLFTFPGIYNRRFVDYLEPFILNLTDPSMSDEFWREAAKYDREGAEQMRTSGIWDVSLAKASAGLDIDSELLKAMEP